MFLACCVSFGLVAPSGVARTSHGRNIRGADHSPKGNMPLGTTRDNQTGRTRLWALGLPGTHRHEACPPVARGARDFLGCNPRHPPICRSLRTEAAATLRRTASPLLYALTLPPIYIDTEGRFSTGKKCADIFYFGAGSSAPSLFKSLEAIDRGASPTPQGGRSVKVPVPWQMGPLTQAGFQMLMAGRVSCPVRTREAHNARRAVLYGPLGHSRIDMPSQGS